MTSAARYKTLANTRPFATLTPISKEEASELRQQHPGLPEDYIEFLEQVGYGSVGPNRFSIYEAPGEPSDIFDEETASACGPVILIGDDFQGYILAFRTTDWSLLEVSPSGEPDPPLGVTFQQYVEEL